MRSRFAALAACAGLAAGLLAGCGSGDDPETTTPARVTETPEELPKLDRGWTPYVNRQVGFAIGRPPGWSVKERGTTTVLRSPTELVVFTVGVDRTGEALSLPPAQSAARTFAALPGFEQDVDSGEPRPFKGHYEGSEVRGRATASESGVRQDVRVIVLRRKGVATATVVLAANAGKADRFEIKQALEAVRTLRTRPIGSGS